jgi:flagellar motor component MotA
MTHEEFITAYYAVAEKALLFSEKARNEGILALEEILNKNKEMERDIWEYGIHFVVDGINPTMIDKILSNIIVQEPDADIRLLKTIQKEAILLIQTGYNPRIIAAIMNSYTNLSFVEDAILEKFYEI